jgi:hypothetical protein
MDSNILSSLLSIRINPVKFRLTGLDVVFWDEADNTPENQAIIEDVIANYNTLAAEYAAAKIPVQKRAAYKAEADSIFVEYQALLAAADADAETRRLEWLTKRAEILARFT